MAKSNLTLDEKITVVQAAIEKEEMAIKAKRDKLAKLRQSLQKLENEKSQIFTNELLQIVGDCGISSDEQKRELIKMVKNAATDLNKSDSSFSADIPAGETNALTSGKHS